MTEPSNCPSPASAPETGSKDLAKNSLGRLTLPTDHDTWGMPDEISSQTANSILGKPIYGGSQTIDPAFNIFYQLTWRTARIGQQRLQRAKYRGHGESDQHPPSGRELS